MSYKYGSKLPQMQYYGGFTVIITVGAAGAKTVKIGKGWGNRAADWI